jgi:hypothetical protein
MQMNIPGLRNEPTQHHVQVCTGKCGFVSSVTLDYATCPTCAGTMSETRSVNQFEWAELVKQGVEKLRDFLASRLKRRAL